MSYELLCEEIAGQVSKDKTPSKATLPLPEKRKILLNFDRCRSKLTKPKS